MILLLGASGYIGEAFTAELRKRNWDHRSIPRSEADYTRFTSLLELLRSLRPSFLINAAGFTGKPNVDACESQKAETLFGNALLPQSIAQACDGAGVPWGHISSGCIYNGGKILHDGQERIETDLTRPELQGLLTGRREQVRGFSETDTPNFSFRHPPCSFYSGSKALGEEAMTGIGRSYVWRLRIPFDAHDGARNYLSKIQRYAKVYDNANSLSHRGDFVKACLDLWERRAPFGTYNLTNPGFVTTRQVIQRVQDILKPRREFEFWTDDEEFYRLAAKTPRSNCILETGKLRETGVVMRTVDEALEDSLRHWRPEAPQKCSPAHGSLSPA